MSTIKVNKLEQRSGCTATVGGGAGKTVTVDATTVTLGRCGGTVSLAPGATQTGFGKTGTVNWCTTAKTSPLTVVSGNGYFINTTGGAVTVTLPSSPSAGDIVAFKDYGNSWQTNNVTINNNGSKINGGCFNANLNTKAQSVTLIYVDGTKGWQDIHDSTANISGVPLFICASGGTVTTCGDFKIHTFNSTSTFVVNTAPTPANNNISYVVVAGGGGATGSIAGGSGAGGYREGKTPATPYTASPLVAPAGLPVAASTTYPVTIGAGGTGDESYPNITNGSDSVFNTITSTGGGKGGNHPGNPGSPGGSGGGAGGDGTSSAGSGNSPPVSPPQGNGGSVGSPNYPQLGAGGGGGAGGSAGSSANCRGGPGGVGTGTAINPAAGTPGPDGALKYFAGGGGGGIYSLSNPNPAYAPGGYGGGGAGWGTGNPIPSPVVSRKGTANTGGGAGQYSSTPACTGGTGGSGIVIIRYKFQ